MEDLLSNVVFKATVNLIPPEKNLDCFWMGIYYSARRSLSPFIFPIATRLYFFSLLLFIDFLFLCAFSYWFFPSLDDMLTFCEFLSVFQDSGRVYFIYLTMICLLHWFPTCLLFFSSEQGTWFVCYLKCPCGQTWVLTCDTSCLQHSKVPIMVSGSGRGKES